MTDILARHWRCFHYDEVFTGREQAAMHFGLENDGHHFETPACISPLRYDELARCRELKAAWADVDEAQAAQERAESDADNYHMMGDELARYFNGARTVHQAYLVLDETVGRALAAEERARTAEARLAALERSAAA
jgi:hypothetical protein